MSPKSTTPAPISKRGLHIGAFVLVVLLAVVVITGIVTRARADTRLHDWTETQAVPTVAVVMPGAPGAANTLDLPGRTEAYSRASIFARVSGYLKSWNVDIGAPVKAGQLLAEIETPDLDQQLLQAKADLASAKANESLAETTAKRWQSMLGTDAISKQEADEKTGDFATKRALTNAAQANVDRVQAMKGFTRIVAPFDGIVTARNTDVGALINAGGGTGPELFTVSDIRKLRVYVSVPQVYVDAIKPGSKAQITVPEHPGKNYVATVESSAQAVNVASGSVLMQLAVDNANGELLPGGFANVKFDLPQNTAVLNVPASALMFDASGLRIATVGSDNKVKLKKVTIARDLGKTIELGSGIEAGDRVIESPPDGVADGDVVHIADPAAKKDAAAPPKA